MRPVLDYPEAFEDMLLDEATRRAIEHPMHAWDTGVMWGAGWAFAIIGMAQAIRDQRLCANCDVGLATDSAGRSYAYCQVCGGSYK